MTVDPEMVDVEIAAAGRTRKERKGEEEEEEGRRQEKDVWPSPEGMP